MIIVYLSPKNEMIAIKSLYICNTSISFFAKWCQNAIQASVQNCSFIAALTHTPSLLHSYSQIHKCRQKASIEFLYKFFLIFRDNSNVSACAWERIGCTHTHTLTSLCMFVLCVSGCVCGCVCLFFVSPSCARLWLEMHKSVFVHIKYSCIILNPLAIFSIWFPI